MAVQYNPGIVTDGLVLCLDAANLKSYPGSGVTWGDLSGNNNTATLINGASYNTLNNGNILFDGLNDYVTTGLNNAFTDFTVCIWFRQNGSAIAYQRLMDKSYINGFWIGRESTNPNKWGGGVRETNSPFGRYITLTDGQWHFIVSRRQGTTHTIFGDGITNNTSGTVSSTQLDSTVIQIGLAVGESSTLLNGNISYVSVYNTALNNEQILQNFNALRGRFGI